MSDSTTTNHVGWPWCGDTPSGGEHRGDCVATRHQDGSITLNWEPDTANCAVVSRDVLEGLVEERNRMSADLRKSRGEE